LASTENVSFLTRLPTATSPPKKKAKKEFYIVGIMACVLISSESYGFWETIESSVCIGKANENRVK
jgi:hypothetical protein